MNWFVQCYKRKISGKAKLNLDVIVTLECFLVRAEPGSCVCAVLSTCLAPPIQMKVNIVLQAQQACCILQMKCRDSNLSLETFVLDC